jgi:hypothetical protein
METEIPLRILIDGTHKTLYACEKGGSERLVLVSVALSVLQTAPGAEAAWQSLCAAAMDAVAIATMEKDE